MKKIVALAVLAAGTLVGAGTAAAQSPYPPQPVPAISAPVTVAPNAPFTMVVSDVVVGEVVTLTFVGETYTQVVSAGQGLTPPPLGSASFALTAPAEAGTYPVNAVTSNGFTLSSSVTVTAIAGPDPGDQGKNPGDQGKKIPGSSALPATGSNLIWPGASIALAAVAGGIGLLLVSKRRRTAA